MGAKSVNLWVYGRSRPEDMAMRQTLRVLITVKIDLAACLIGLAALLKILL
jgi:hypothetical protein